MRHITLLALPNGIAATVIGPFDVFRNAGLIWQAGGPRGKPLCKVQIASLDGQPVMCGNRFTITPHLALAEVNQTDLLYVCSPGPNVMGFMDQHPEVTHAIRAFHERGVTIACVCAASFLLAESGILDGKVATTHWAERAEFGERYPRVKLKAESMITDNTDIICAGGAYAALDLALYLVEKYHGRETALMCSKSLLLETDRDSQARFTLFDFQKQHGDEKIKAAQQWLEQHFTETFLLHQLAQQHGMSPRNFSRRFKKATGDTPLHYQQRLRIAAAGEMLEKAYASIEEVCFKVGYEDPDFFRSIFKRHMGVTPASYRHKFARV